MAQALLDPRAVLGLDDGATVADARRAYRRLAKRAHPDTGGDGAEFVALADAYAALRPLLPLVARRPSPYDWALRPAPPAPPARERRARAVRPSFATVLAAHLAGYAQAAAAA